MNNGLEVPQAMIDLSFIFSVTDKKKAPVRIEVKPQFSPELILDCFSFSRKMVFGRDLQAF